MTSQSRQQGAGTDRVDIGTHLNIASNTLFPFSSPNLDDRLSVRSGQIDYNYDLQSPEFGSSHPRKRTNGVGYTSESDGLPLRAYKQHRAGADKQRSLSSEARRFVQNNAQTNLRIVTDFSQPQVRSGQVKFNRVAAKPTGLAINRAHSIVSQKGVNELSSPLPLPLKSSSQARRNGKAVRKSMQETRREKNPPSPTRSSVVFGLCVPEHEAKYHRSCDLLESAVTLVTPQTPHIIVTPADDSSSHSPQHVPNREHEQARENFPTGFYSRAFVSSDHRRTSSDSQRQMLPESCDTARPKSQGWWNLMLSPVLSRAGTLKSLKASSSNEIPPVPAIPLDTEPRLASQTPASVMSPATPRRLGIATLRTTTYSQESEWEDERELSEDDMTSIHHAEPASPREYLAHKAGFPGPLEVPERINGEGLAAEYYHACAIEQLAGITYFECVNHSCAERLPELRSIYDMGCSNTAPNSLTTDQSSTHKASSNSVDTSQAETHMNQTWLTQQLGNDVSGPRHQEPELSLQTQDSLSPTMTMIDTGEVVSPNLRQANTAKFSRAKAVNSEKPSPAPSSGHVDPLLNQLTIHSTDRLPLQPPVDSPGPVSPEANRSIEPIGAMSMAPLHDLPGHLAAPLDAPIAQQNEVLVPVHAPQLPGTIIYYPHGQAVPYPVVVPSEHQYSVHHTATSTMMERANPGRAATNAAPIASSIPKDGAPMETCEHHVAQAALIVHHAIAENDVGNPEEKDNSKTEKNKQMKLEKAKQKKKSVFGTLCCCFNRARSKEDNHRRRNIIIAVVLLVVIILCILFAVLFTRGHGGAESIESQWLNLTGFPPIPTGISTIAQPNLSASQNGCVQPNTMWSCSLPKEEQASVSPNQPDQPNFRFQILFKNGTVPANLTIPLGGHESDSAAGESFVPNPSPPSQLDQTFLGKTTDNVTQPFQGEVTPFFITFMTTISDQAVGQSTTNYLFKRQNGVENPLNSIPAPSISSDGTASPANLLPDSPFLISQPIKLYNRGLPDEHYGFYNYFDKSIFLAGVILGNNTGANDSLTPVSADENGGSTELQANVRCTWSQTRFIVKMYTNPAFGATLLPSPPSNTTTDGKNSKNNKTSSAADFSRPGSFPFPTTIALDRHGGDINEKLLYCYGMNDGFIEVSSKILVAEVRSFGGTLINPSPSLINDPTNPAFNSTVGGIDGGTGGCGCSWQNWQ